MYEFADGIFVEDSSVRFYGFQIQTRMAVVSLPGRRLWLYSPVSLSCSLREELGVLGEMACVVSPNKIHNVTLAAYRNAYPEARFYAPPGLPERRPDLNFEVVLTEEPEGAWQPELDHVLSQGNLFFSEALFFHRRSRTLLVGDFVEDFDRDQPPDLPARWPGCLACERVPWRHPSFASIPATPRRRSDSSIG